ncbi:MAG: DUF4832 domain-containing protein [Ignavibacterium sp.]|nr:MAG: DUF4832 domain-containing protein [Ignavibacterium sp.]
MKILVRDHHLIEIVKNIIIQFVFLLTFSSFNSFSQSGSSVVIYNSTEEIFTNPERGFTAYRTSPITLSFINSVKAENVSVVQRIYTIPEFRYVPLSAGFLNTVESDLRIARQGGIKLVMRFSYTNDINGEDAARDTILIHINQLQPIFEENWDVIAYIEAGFIGSWGEWYNSTHGLNNTNDRRAVLFALLDALPIKRNVVVRTPNYKRLIFVDDQPLSFAEAFSGTRKSRTGAHNDCFLANATDFGTYLENDIEGDKDYLNLDNRFVPQGGETCSPSEYSDCNNALIDLNRMHWSLLNKDYHPSVINEWITEGCIDDIKRRLGYRFSLLQGEYTDSVKPGGIFNIQLDVANYGFASPYNPRSLEFILRNVNTKKRYRLITEEDPRLWPSEDTVRVSLTAGIIGTMPEGEYEFLMHLADPVQELHSVPDYSIRLANENVWEDSTGFNTLLHSVNVNSNGDGDDYSGEFYFLPEDSTTYVPPVIQIDGLFDDWLNVLQLDVAPDEEGIGDALNPDVDLVDLWLTDGEDNVYVSYILDGEFKAQYYYHVFIDADNNNSTGFRSGGSYAGIDLMVENDILYQYAGQNGEWGWASWGSVLSAIGSVNTDRIELEIPKNILSYFGADNSFQIIFNINELDDLVDDDYAPNSYRQGSYNYIYQVTSVEASDENIVAPGDYKVEAYPNPFNNQVNIKFNIPREQIISASIYDVLGNKVKTYLPHEIYSNKLSWNGKNSLGIDAGSGIYIFVIMSYNFTYSTKIVLLK